MRIKLENKKTTEPKKNKLNELLSKDYSFSKTFSIDKKFYFYNQLYVLLSSGLDIKSTFELLLNDKNNQKVHFIIEDLKHKIENGYSLSNALKSDKRNFSSFEFYSIEIGEETGKLNSVLFQLSIYYQKQIKQRRQIISALTYPFIILITAFGAIFFMFNFMVPMFSEVFKRFNGDLPALTKLVIHISSFTQKYYLFFFLFIGIIWLIIYSKKDTPTYKKIMSKIITRIPIFGELISKIYLARFCGSMEMLLSSKVNMAKSILMVKQMIDFYPIQCTLDEVEADIIKGKSLNEALSKHKVYEHRLVYLVKVGEEVNKINTFLGELNKQYNEEVDYKTSIIGSLIEPFLIVFLGVIVGIILIAMYLPLFQLSNNF